MRPDDDMDMVEIPREMLDAVLSMIAPITETLYHMASGDVTPDDFPPQIVESMRHTCVDLASGCLVISGVFLGHGVPKREHQWKDDRIVAQHTAEKLTENVPGLVDSAIAKMEEQIADSTDERERDLLRRAIERAERHKAQHEAKTIERTLDGVDPDSAIDEGMDEMLAKLGIKMDTRGIDAD